MRRNKRFEAHAPRLFAYALNLSRDPDVAADLVQDCAVRALGAFGSPSDDRAYRAWLFRILRNLFIDQFRRNGLVSIETREPDALEQVDDWPPAEDAIITSITIKQALGRLSTDHRDIVLLVDMIGFTYAEVSTIADIPLGTVMSRLSRARKAMLEAMVEPNVTPIRRRGGVRRK